MRAAVFHGAGIPLQLQQVPDPTPQAGELVMKVARCGICGTDLHRTEGHAGFTWPPGFILGHEAAGEVVAVAPDVSDFRVGDRVCALPFSGCRQCAACLAGDPLFCERGTRPMMGGFAEYMLASARETVKLPASLSMEDGALVEPLAVGLHSVDMSQLRPGSRVLIIGAGSIGLAVLYWARLFGAAQITMLARSRRHESMARGLGATGFVTSTNAANEEILASLEGPPDVVFEAAGMPGLIADAVAQVRPRGTIIIAGLCMGADTFNPAIALRKEARMLFSVAYSLADYRRAIDTLDAGNVEPRSMITNVVSLDALPAAFEALRTPSDQCKVMTAPWST